jgi:hypothetical protein
MNMPRVIATPDNLNERNGEFAQSALTRQIFLNSVPKSGSHLLKNIVRMFVPVDQQYDVDFIQYPTLKHHAHIFQGPPKLSWGHLLFGEAPSIVLKDVRHILLVRDPYDWVLARTRFFLSDNFQANLDHMKQGRVDINDFMNMMIVGVHNRFPPMQDIYLNNAVGWLGTSAHIIYYEDIIKHLKNLNLVEAKTFFADLLGFADIGLPEDWQERVRIGSDRKQSGTARENLTLKGQKIPSELPQMQKKLVDYTNPGLRELLGYK